MTNTGKKCKGRTPDDQRKGASDHAEGPEGPVGTEQHAAPDEGRDMEHMKVRQSGTQETTDTLGHHLKTTYGKLLDEPVPGKILDLLKKLDEASDDKRDEADKDNS